MPSFWSLRRQPDPFQPEWVGWLEEGVWQYRHLSTAHRERVQRVVAHLAARKHWSGGSGFEVTPRMRVVVSGVAALLTVGFDEPYFFPKLRSIILYPAGYRQPNPDDDIGLLGAGDPLGFDSRWGEAWQSGPVILSWRNAERQARVRGSGDNLVIHEMAHHIDGLDGDMDGVPHFGDTRLRREWLEVADAEYHRLLGQSWRQEVTLLNHYGASNQAEFLAVATECFFERPHEMRARHAELYTLLTRFFHQDPTAWILPIERPPDKPHQKSSKSSKPRRLSYAELADLASVGLSGGDESFARGVLMLQEERYADAARLFTEALAADPNDAEALEHRAAARLELRDFQGAIRDAEGALAMDPEAGDAMLTLASASLELGDDAGATRQVRALLRERRDSPHAWRLLGRLRLRAGDARTAGRAFRRSLRDSRYDALSHYWLAECLEQLNEPEHARQRRERAFLLDPSLQKTRPRA